MFSNQKNCLPRASKSLSSSVRVNASKMSSGLRFVGHFLHSEEENLFGIHDLNDKRVSVLEVTKGEGKIKEQETIVHKALIGSKTVFQQK